MEAGLGAVGFWIFHFVTKILWDVRQLKNFWILDSIWACMTGEGGGKGTMGRKGVCL